MPLSNCGAGTGILGSAGAAEATAEGTAAADSIAPATSAPAASAKRKELTMVTIS
jgi:hypothetical protein